MSATLTKPKGGDENRTSQLLAIFWTEVPVSLIFVCLRFYVRTSIESLGIDDYTMLATWILYLLGIVFATLTVVSGGARHLYYLPLEELSTVERWNLVSQPFGIMALPFAKASISLLLLKIIGPNTTWRKWLLWGNMGVFFLLSVLLSILNFVQCSPPRALWEHVPGARCWNSTSQRDFAIFVSSYSALLDFCLAALPVTIVWNLTLKPSGKIGLCALLGLGIFAGIFSAIKTAHLHELGSRSDITWATFDLLALSSSELFLLIVCGSIPALKPLYDKLAYGKPIVSNRKSRQYGSGGFSQMKSGSDKRPVAFEASQGSSRLDDGSITIEQRFDVDSSHQAIIKYPERDMAYS